MNILGEKCGIFGIYSSEACVQDIFHGIDFLQHRGQEYCGMATFDGLKIRRVTHHGKAANSFTEEELNYLSGNSGIGHVSLSERQPMTWQSRLGQISVAFSGNIINSGELIREMKDHGHAFYRNYDTEVIAKIVMEAPDMVTGISALSKRFKGAYSLVILT
ncbi:MAG: hypothetical protein Q7I93_04150, partial [Syntrophales bacterium]|nr:hypothetical protein [Syntrophales bacterium]